MTKKRIVDAWNDPKEGPTLSFELSPPRNEKAADALGAAVREFCGLKPDFFSVTFGAGGSTREGSHTLVDQLKRGNDQEVIAYIAPYGMGPDDVSAVLRGYQDLGINSILAVRGDRPRDLPEEYQPHPESFSHASDLITFIKGNFDLCVGAAGYPEGHSEAPDLEADIKVLRTKVDNGAEFVICQYFYDNEYFLDFTRRAREAGINVPLVPGIMPIYSVKMMEILAGICGATITAKVREGIAGLPEGDKEALEDWGVEFALAQCRALIGTGVPGLHFYTLNRKSSTMKIVSRLKEEGLL